MERTVITRSEAAAFRASQPHGRDDDARGAWDDDQPAGGGDAAAPSADDYKDRLFKYIPADVIALYLTLDGILATAAPAENLPLDALRWIVAGVVFVLTPLYLARVAKVTKRKQIAISTSAFAVWAFYLGGPFKTLEFYHPVYGALLFVVFTFVVPIWEVES